MGAWRVTVLGVRGSMPVPAADRLGYGGHTSSFLVNCGPDAPLLALDAGTGLAAAGGALLPAGRPARLEVLISHFHLDHLLGLAALPLLDIPGAQLTLHGPPGLQQALQGLLAPPYWPVGLAGRPARVRVLEHPVGEGFWAAEGAVWVETLAGCHPGKSCLYRLSDPGHRLVYGLDCELQGEMAARLAEFAAGAGLLIWDAGFAPGEEKPGWGHSTWRQGLAVGRCAGVKALLFAHYGAALTDQMLNAQQKAAAAADARCRFAKEGMVVEL